MIFGRPAYVPHPRRAHVYDLNDGKGWFCSCGRRQDPDATKRARNNGKRGKHQEREWSRRLGMRQTGGLGKEDDALNDMFVGQAKSMHTVRFPGWMSLELDKLRARWLDRIPILGILETPGAGKRPRRLIVIDEADWIALHVGTDDPPR